jgi:hypothetical protein
MVDADAGEHRAVGIEHVDGVQRPPSPTSRIAASSFAPRKQQGRQRAEFEVGELDCAARALDRANASQSALVARLAPADAHALVVAQQVRRGIEAGAVARACRMLSSIAQVEPLPLVPPR